jgi:hypothetical protein
MDGVEIKEINPADPGPSYFEPTTIIRRVTSDIVEFKSQAEFVDGDGVANDDICQVCHQQTSYYNTGTELGFHADYGADSQPGGNCTSCHKHEDGFKASGGHSDTDFDWTDTTKTSCGSTSCHDWGNNLNVVADIHNSTCTNCHNNSSGGNGTTIGYSTTPSTDVGDATLASTEPPHTDECTVCHTLDESHTAYAQTHHDRSDSYAANGTCSQCHDDPRVAAGYIREAQAQQLSCRVCHVRITGSTLEVVAIITAEAGNGATGSDAGNSYATLTTPGYSAKHTFANTNATGITDAIDNYGICFYCHGNTPRTGYAGASAPSPYHALPQAGAYQSGSTAYIGGLGWKGNLTATTDGSTFRGGLTWDDPTGNSALFPIGKDRLNIAYAQHSLAKGATNDTDYTNQNSGATDAYMTFATDLIFGMQTVPHLSQTWAVPHSDSICSTRGCDDITGISITEVEAGNNQPIGFDVTATSSTDAILHVIYGGVQVGTMASEGTASFRWGNAGNWLDGIICLDQFNADNVQPVWIVSEDGGSVNAGSGFSRGSNQNTDNTDPPTCGNLTTQPVW